ncbi:LysM peptidoglycan-binding domain-containing protein [soil metagenome]
MILKYQVVGGDTLSALAHRFYGDTALHPVLSVHNRLADPDHILVGQELEIPYVTFRHRVQAGETTAAVAQQHYGDAGMKTVIEVANHAGQRGLVPGELLLIPDLVNVGHHSVVAGETPRELAQRWYGDESLWPVITVANHLGDVDPPVGQVLIQPQLNRRHHVVTGDTLWQLATDHYGDHDVAGNVALLAAANKLVDPDQLTVGRVLFFPSLSRP